MREKFGKRKQAHTNDNADPEEQAKGTAHKRYDGGLGEELTSDIHCGGSKSLTYANLACSLGDGDQHDVHGHRCRPMRA